MRKLLLTLADWLIGPHWMIVPAHPKKYIGSTFQQIGHNKRTYTINVLFFMSENDTRSIVYECPDWMDDFFRELDTYRQAMDWMKGGPFPKDFVPMEDGPLFEMLQRMTVDKIIYGPSK